MASTDIPRFGRGNAKLPDSTLTFSLPSGFTCPGALQCLAKADRETGRIADGSRQEFRCFEASAECRLTSVRKHRWHNFDLLRQRDADSMAALLLRGIDAARQIKSTHVRWFTGGDFFSPSMRDAVIAAAMETSDLIHYAYTKSLPFFIIDRDPGEIYPEPPLASLPPNLLITASWGGRFDWLIPAGGFRRSACVVNTIEQAEAAGLAIDTTDRLAWQPEPTHFCHLTHGTQPTGSLASQAIQARKRRGEFSGYSAKRKAIQSSSSPHA